MEHDTFTHSRIKVGAAQLRGRALLLALLCLATQINSAKAVTYVGGTITFSNAMPTGVLVYKCTGTGSSQCDSQEQLGDNGYVTPIPPQSIGGTSGGTVDPAPQAFLYGPGSYVLWQYQQQSPGQPSSTAWNSCTLTVDPQQGPSSNCTGWVWVNNLSTDRVVSINLYNSNGFIMTNGTTYSTPPKLTAPPSPRQNQPASSTAVRQFTVTYFGLHQAICVNVLGTFNQLHAAGIRATSRSDGVIRFTFSMAAHRTSATQRLIRRVLGTDLTLPTASSWSVA